MKRTFVLLLGMLFVPAEVLAQIPSQVEKSARSQVVMVREPRCWSCGGGIIVGYDDHQVYIATAAHVVEPVKCDNPSIKVEFDGIIDPRASQVLKVDPLKDLALVVVNRDAQINHLLEMVDFSMLAPGQLPPEHSPVHSIGCSGSQAWSFGFNETLLPSKPPLLKFRSPLAEGQSGGALYNEAWEMLGMPEIAVEGVVSAWSIKDVLHTMRDKWAVPVLLSERPPEEHVRGAEEIARESVANIFVERARQAREEGDILGAITYISEARQNAVTPLVRAEALLIPKPPLTHRYTLSPAASNGFSAIALYEQLDLLAVGAENGDVQLFKLSSGTPVRKLVPAQSALASLAFSADGRILVGGIRGGPIMEIAVWNLDSDKPPQYIPIDNMYGGEISDVEVINSARVIGLANAMLFVSDLSIGKELWRQRLDIPEAKSLRPLGGNEFFLSGEYKNAVVTFKDDKFTLKQLPVCGTQAAPIGQFVYNPAALLATTPPVLARACSTQLRLSTLDGANERRATGHSEGITEVAPMPSAAAFATGSWDGTVRIWDMTTGEPLARSGLHHGGIQRILTTHQSDTLVVLEADVERFKKGGSVRVWSYSSRLAIKRSQLMQPTYLGLPPPLFPNAEGAPPPSTPTGPSPYPSPPDSSPALLAGLPFSPFMPRGPVSTCFRDDGKVEFLRWDGAHIIQYDPESSTDLTRLIPPGPTVSLAVGQGCRFAAVLSKERLTLYERSTLGSPWTDMGSEAVTTSSVSNTVLAAHANVVAWMETTSSAGTKAVHLRMRSWEPPHPPTTLLEKDGDMGLDIALSSDGSRVATYTMDGTIHVWDRASGKSLLERGHPMGTPASLVFDPHGSGDRLFVPAFDHIEIWGIGNEAQKRITPKGINIYNYAVNADGSLGVLSGNLWRDDAPQRRLWIIDGARLQPLTSMVLPIDALQPTLSPNGEHLLLLIYGKVIQALGLNNDVDISGARAMTGNRWTGTAIGPFP